jgi:hypothetical protein
VDAHGSNDRVSGDVPGRSMVAEILVQREADTGKKDRPVEW